LVDPAVGGFQPIPSVKLTQAFESYKIEGGTTKYVPHGNDQPAVSPAVVIIDQVDDITAQAMLVAIQALVADPLNQPITVQWNDLIPNGPFDGAWWIMDVSAPETTTDFPGRIKITLSMAPASGMPVGLGPDESFAGASDVSLSSPADGDVVTYRISDSKWTNKHLFGVWRALWLVGTAYVVNDLVYYAGSSYVSILAGTGQQPDIQPTYWSLVAQKGATGSTGPTGAAGTMSASSTVTSSAVGDTGVPGSASTASAGDHKHAREAFGGVPTNSAVADTAATGSSTTLARSDHLHGREALGGAAGASAVADTAAAGTSVLNSRSDHRHSREAFGASVPVGSGTAAVGSAATVVRSDHVHPLTSAASASAIVAASTGINSTETQVVTLALAAGTIAAGTSYRITASGVCTSTVANASHFRARLGTTTLSGNIAVDVSPTAAASGTAIPFLVNILVTVRTNGASGSLIGGGALDNNGVTGVSAAAQVVAQTTATVAVDTTVANLIELTFQAAAATTTCTFHNAIITVVKS
jgi:hypothetical protein